MKITTHQTKIESLNIIGVEAGTNCPQGGDSASGGRTYLRLSDETSTGWEFRIKDQDGVPHVFAAPQSIELILGGDAEHTTILQALKFAAAALENKIVPQAATEEVPAITRQEQDVDFTA